MTILGSANHIRFFCLGAALVASTGCEGSTAKAGASSDGGSSVGGMASAQSSETSADKGGTTGKGSAASSLKSTRTGGATGRMTSAAGGAGGDAGAANEGGHDDGTSRSGGASGADDSKTGGRSATAGGASGSGGMPRTSSSKNSGRSGGDGGSGTSDRGSGGATGTVGDSNAGGVSSTGGSASGGTSSTGEDGEATIVPDPSWTCGMAAGIPSPASGTLVFNATLTIDKSYDVGTTQFGKRRLFTVKNGTLKGDKVTASALSGGLELELTLSTGAVELEQINILKASDGTQILMRNCGVAPAGASQVRVVADFEVPNSASSLTWLNTGKFVGIRTIDTAGGKIQLDVYDTSKVSTAEPKIQLKDPTGVPNQTWDCVTATGTNGATVLTESVTLGSSISIGASKRGTRNIIPITGGTVTGGTALGSLSGSVISGGADYQLMGSGSAALDARYALSSKDGEVIVVRNCGPMSGLTPVFETSVDGPYAVLNTKQYLSSAPGSASGGVSITFYERK